MSHLKLMNTRTRFLLVVCALLLTGVASAFAIREVSADSLSKLGISPQSRVGRLIEQIAPRSRQAMKTAVPSTFAAVVTTTLGNYANTTITMGASTTVTPTAVPSDTTSMSVTASSKFLGTLTANPATGVVRITNAYPAGSYTVTVRAFGGTGTVTKTFTLTVQTGAPACAGTAQFTNAPDVALANGDRSESAAAGDFNGDGKLDFVVAHWLGSVVSVRLGDGAGGFTSAPDVTSANFSPISIAAGDFNGDGKLDFVVASDSYDNVPVYLGDGAGGFSRTATISVGNRPWSIAVADFNNDGKLDFATANNDSNDVSIRLGDGTGGFNSAGNVGAGTVPIYVATADFNNDGNVDLAIGNLNSDNVSIRLGNGAGGFTNAATVSAGDQPNSIAVGDFNGDGNQDFVVACLRSTVLFVRLGNGTGGFTNAPDVTVNANQGARSVVAADFNNDGRLDLAAAQWISSLVAIRLGDGAGGFTNAPDTNANTGYDLEVGDFNRDGKLDFASINSGAHTAYIRLGACNNLSIAAQAGVTRQQGSPVSNSQIATTSAGTTVTVTSANPSNGVTLSNIVNSGGTVTANIVAACGAANASFTLQASDGVSTATATLNVAVTNNTAPTLTYGSASANTGASTSNTPTTATDNGSITSYSVQSQGNYTGTISVNSGGVVSISNAAPVGNHTITIRATDNCGAPSGVTDATFTLTVGCPAINITPVTLSNAAVGTAYSRSLTVTPSGTYSFAIISGQLPKGLTLSTGGVISGTPSEFGIFTFTLAASQTSPGSCRGSRLYTLQVTGSNCAAPNFTDRADFTAGGGPLGIVAADFNRDGKNDMAVANENGDSVVVLLGDGIGGFSTSSTVSGLPDARFLDVGDFNGDGNPDLIVALRTGGSVAVLFGNGAGDFPTSTNVDVGFIQSSVRTGDFNGDGKLDFIAFSFGTANQLSVVLGNGSGGFSIAPGSPVQLGFAASGTLNDFNKDGKLDVAIARTSPAQVIVMYGDGTGALTADAPISFATNLAGIFTADFNLDGNFDLAVPHSDDSLTLLLGDGSGGFSPTAGSPISGAATLAASDLNGDGIPDLVGITRVGFGNGSGGFTFLNNLNTGSDRRSGTVADLNGDGKPDLAVINYNPNKVVVLFNNCAPQITGTTIARQQGSPAANSQIATVSDPYDTDASLTVTATSVPAGLTVTNIVNTGGVITADVSANCAISTGAKTVVLQVSDGALTATADLTVNVTANTAPSVTYANRSVNAGGSTTNSPTTATDNGSITGYAVQSQGTYTGTISVNASGLVSISGAAPVGVHTITIRATDNCGAPSGVTDATFTLTVGNNAPTITAGAALSRQQGSAGSVSTIATVSDGETPVGNLVVTATTVPTGITVTSITNTTGTITANVDAGCNALVGVNTVVLTVTDGNSGTATANLTVNVTTNTAPSVTYANVSVNAGASTTNTPTTATDNGSITGYGVQSAGTFSGMISVNASGVVSISGAAPVGTHTITIQATDNCNLTANTTFTLTVGNNAPTITAGTALTRQRGSAGTVSTIATASDGETPVGSLTVMATTVPAGITVTSIVNTAGTITANVAADCTATLGNNTVILTVTDGNSGTATANLTVNVTANTAPSVTYANVSVNAGGSTSNSPTTATDNGSITGYTVQSQGTYTGTISVNASGAVSISGAAPVGAHTITIRATDNCGAPSGVTDATFTLTVGNNAPTITAGTALTRQRGSAGTLSTIATVSDGETPVGSLVVTATTVPAGITVTGITNAAGTISGTVAADCTAIIGANTIVLTVTDGNSGTATANLTVSVTANTAPSVTYANVSVNAGGSTSNSPTTATDNGSITGYTVQSQGTYTGTISVNASGVVSISGAAPVGAHIITIQATDNCNLTANTTFTLTVGNNAPTITAGAALTRQRGTAGTLSTIATVSDGETPVGSLVVTATTVPAGITITGISNMAGTITANVAADCTAIIGANTIVLTVTDGNSGTATANLTVNVTANTAPSVTYGNVSVNAGAATTNSPTTATDNGSITGYVVQSQGTYTGTISVNASGVVSIGSAAPVGMHTITIQAMDNCNLTAITTFTLTVGNNLPTITAGAALTRQRGTAASVSTIATVSDGETPVGSLVVTATTVPAGITVTSITNSAGTITANVAASCNATVGANTVVLTVTDGNSGTATANLTVTVTANTAPSVTYANVSVNAGASTSNGPTTATDNGSITGYTVQSQGTYTGTITVNASGAVSISGAAPVGAHTITIRATDNCGAPSGITDATFTLTVGNNAPTITAGAALSRQQGSAGTISTIATVSDGETPVGSLVVTATTVPTGITVTSITNSAGTISANVAAGCNALVGLNTIVLTVTDGNSGTATANLTVTVTANTAPSVTYANVSVSAGGSTSNSPTTATDNGSITGYSLQSAGTYSGTISVNPTTGAVSISNAAPVGSHTITIRATDNCGAPSGITDATFTLTVNNTAPTITPASTLIRQRGTAGIVATIATVNDAETAPGSLTVTATTVPSGISVTSISNSNGTVSASVAAGCAATLGNNTVVLTVTDANSGTATANLTVNVIDNNPPTLVYPASSTALGSSSSINPTTATDNGSITGFSIVSVTPAMTVAPTVNSSGVVSINNAGPFGSHTIIVRATDNCTTTTDASFTLNVGCGSIAITPTSLVNGLTFVTYTATLSATGGGGNYAFTLQSGTLPVGLMLNGNVITGTPTTPGASVFTIRATDDNGCFGERTYTLNIGSTGLMYYPLARPVRLLDTRPGASPNACFQPNAPVAGGNPRTQPARGTCDGLTIPANATTITGHITTVQSGGGFLTLYPSDAPQPAVTNSNYLVNEVLNNAFTVGLGAADGAFKLFVSSNTDIVIDVTGYYAPPSAGGLYFHPLPKPIRLLETRQGFTGCQTTGTPLQAATMRTQTGVLTCDGVTIPIGAQALVGNATTTLSQNNGYLTLYPADASQPFTASSNYVAAVNRNAPFTVGLSLNGEFNIYTSATTDLVIDVMGYFSTQASDTNGQGLLFNSLGSPLRLMDTRAGQPACYTPGAPMTGATVYLQDTQIPCTNLTSAARALVGNVSALNAVANGFLTFWPSNAAQPTVATSNYQTGRTFNRHFTVGLGPDVAFKRYTSGTTDLIIDISGFFAP